ncbi:hypothetical protein [Nonomuraea sp. NPDC050786]|uniref:hypothetical protein n=1 Tax=Nonomuraea sp. NPDC050786 TaxID=3154840 RepID=UPI0033EF58CD
MDAIQASERSESGDPDRSPLANRLLVQIPANRAEEFWYLGADYGAGIVVSGGQALSAVSLHKEELAQRPVMVDRRRYAGAKRPSGTTLFTQSWIQTQRQMRLPVVLTDSGYVGRADRSALVAILEQTVRAGTEVTAVLPLSASWLADDEVKHLIGEINQHRVPVALVLEHTADPLATQWAVRGLKHLLEQARPAVSLLCTDLSGIGALAHGAAWVAVGVTSSLRHLYPADRPGPPYGTLPTKYAIVPRLLSFMRVERILEGWAHTQQHDDLVEDLWRCACAECGNRTMDRFATCADVSLAAHNASVLDDLQQQVTSPASWASAIDGALGWYQWIEDEYHLIWEPPRFMNAWLPRSQR